MMASDTWPNVPRAFSMRRINAWKTHGSNYDVVKTMRLCKRMENAHGTFGHSITITITTAAG